jgi:enamine deaminase RidA (YjgF/YER057c/UK114 family)
MTMIGTTLRTVPALTVLGITAAVLASTPAKAQNQNMEVIHHPNYDKNVFMPFVPAIKIKSGKLLWLAGTTALPVYHDHPHKRDQIQQYMVNDLEAQTRAAMDGIKQTLDAAGASFKDCGALLRLQGTTADGRHWQGECGDQFVLCSLQPQTHLDQYRGPGTRRAGTADRNSDGCGGRLGNEM